MVSEGKSLHVRRSKERRNEYKQEREQAFNLIHKVVSLAAMATKDKNSTVFA